MAGKLFIGLSWLLGVSLISGCGGSGGEEKSIFSNVAYAEYQGATSSVELDATNAKKFAHYVTQSVDLVEFLHSFAGIEKSYGERVYVLTGGNFRAELLDQEFCPLGGDVRVSEQFNDKDEGRITIVFEQCNDGSGLFDGTVIVDGRLSGDGFSVKVRIGELRMSNQDISSSELDLVISGEIESLLNEYGYYRDSTQWTANLVIASQTEDLMIKVQDLVRTRHGSSSNYHVTGDLLISDEGRGGISLDTSAQTLNVTGNHSSLNINFDLNEEGSDGYFFPVNSLAIQLNSERESIPAQTITLTPEQLIEQYFRNEQAPQITWNDPMDVTKGDVVELEPQIVESDSFLEYSWSVVSATNECEVITNNAGASYAITSDCDGDVVARLSVFDGFNAYAHDYTFRFKKAPAQVTFESFDDVADVSSTFSLNATIANPEEGPFEYQLAYGLPGASISESGVFNWALDADYPNLFSRMEFHYGASVTNEDSSHVDIPISVDFGDSPDLVKIYTVDEREIPFNYVSAKDIEPSNPNGDIAFIGLIMDRMNLIKFNKSSRTAREVAQLRKYVYPERIPFLDTSLAYIDWNQDGATDIAYLDVISDGSSGQLLQLNVFDLKNEVSLLQRNLFSAPSLPVLNLRAINTSSTNSYEFLITVAKQDTFQDLINDVWVSSGIFLFDHRSGNLRKVSDAIGQLHMLEKQITPGYPSLLVLQDTTISMLTWNVSLAAYQTASALNLQDLFTSDTQRLEIAMIHKTLSNDNEAAYHILLQSDSISCRLARLRARILVDASEERVLDSCLLKTLVVSNELAVLSTKSTPYLSFNITGLDSVEESIQQNIVLASIHIPGNPTSSLAGIDLSSGDIVWSYLFQESSESWRTNAAVEYLDTNGVPRIAAGSTVGIWVTR